MGEEGGISGHGEEKWHSVVRMVRVRLRLYLWNQSLEQNMLFIGYKVK